MSVPSHNSKSERLFFGSCFGPLRTVHLCWPLELAKPHNGPLNLAAFDSSYVSKSPIAVWNVGPYPKSSCTGPASLDSIMVGVAGDGVIVTLDRFVFRDQSFSVTRVLFVETVSSIFVR